MTAGRCVQPGIESDKRSGARATAQATVKEETKNDYME